MKIFPPVMILLLLAGFEGRAQNEEYPAPPAIKSYQNNPGKVTKYNNFNYMDIFDGEGHSRQAMGKYWEISYVYDSTFRQKRKFKQFVEDQILADKGHLYYQDTVQVHFFIPAPNGNVWGRLILSNDRVYRLRLIKEKSFEQTVHFDTPPLVTFDEFVESVPLPPRLNYLPNSVITRIQVSKFDHREYTWNNKDTLFREQVMGPFWNVKIEVKNQEHQVDKAVSSVEILENYYRAATKAGGKILRSRPREVIFTLPLDKSTLWCRVTVALDGVYFIRAVDEADKDRTPPEITVRNLEESVDTTSDDGGK